MIGWNAEACWLPHRQLRKQFAERIKHQTLAAAQAAKKDTVAEAHLWAMLAAAQAAKKHRN